MLRWRQQDTVEVITRYRVLTTPGDSVGTAFAGSPTITIDGKDVFPADGGSAELACRLYLTPDGLAGLPTVDQLMDGMNAHGS